MKAIECSVEISAPSEAIFDLVHDYPRRLTWDPFLREARLLGIARTAGVGVTALCRARLAAGGGVMETVYVSYRRPRVAAVKMIRGPRYLRQFAATIRQDALSATTTRVTYKFNLSARPGWLRPVLEPLLGAVLRRETRRRLDALRSYLESGNGAAPNRIHPAATVVSLPPSPPQSLYRQLLGASWQKLDEELREFHGARGPLNAGGRFQVRHGDGRPARLIARLARLPAAGDDIDVRLTVTPIEDAERWRRTFAGRPLVSLQRKQRDGLLAERFGPLELRFRLEISDGTLAYHPKGVVLRLGLFGIRLPGGLSPHVSAREQKGAGGGQVHVSVCARLPLLGGLLAYEGTLTRVEGKG